MLICSNVKGALLRKPLSHIKSYSVRRTHLKTSSTMSSFVPHAHHCRRNLANFFLSVADEPAQWLCITQLSNTNSSSIAWDELFEYVCSLYVALRLSTRV
jgi:hypothetical protein